MTRDPVCGAEVDETKAPLRAVYRGEAYYFCSGSCKARFDRDPASYVGDEGAANRPGGPATSRRG